MLMAFNGFIHDRTRDSRLVLEVQTRERQKALAIRTYFLAQWEETAVLCLCQIANLFLTRINCSRTRQTTYHRNQRRTSVHWGSEIEKSRNQNRCYHGILFPWQACCKDIRPHCVLVIVASYRE